MRLIFQILIAVCLPFTGLAEATWQLKKDSDGIKVYVSSVEGSQLKAVKLSCSIPGTMSRLTALLLDAKAHEKWVYGTRNSYAVKELGNGHQLYYSEMSMPWPVTNRDLVIDLKLTQHPDTKTLTVRAQAVKGHVKLNKDIVRVPMSDVTWTVVPAGNNLLKIDYIAQADPGGTVPNWVVNMFLAKGPYESFRKLKEIMASDAYAGASFEFIKD